MVFKSFNPPIIKDSNFSLCSFCKTHESQTTTHMTYAFTKMKDKCINILISNQCSKCDSILDNICSNQFPMYGSYLETHFDHIQSVFNYKTKKCIIIPNKNKTILKYNDGVEHILVGMIGSIHIQDITSYMINKYMFIPIHAFLFHYCYIDPWNPAIKPKGYVHLSEEKNNKYKCSVCGCKNQILQSYPNKTLCQNEKCLQMSRMFEYYDLYSNSNVRV